MMAPTFTIARNPEPGTRLPYLLRLPIEGEGDVVLACRETWPGVKDAYCHDGGDWPAEAEVVESVRVVACWRDGPAVHLTLDRAQRRRSMFVWTRKAGRTLIFWRTPKTMAAARPGLKVPSARFLDDPITIAVDAAERYAWSFKANAPTLVRRRLPVGDYGVLDADGRLVAVVERKGAGEVATRAVGGTMALALAELATVPRAVVIVEGRLSDVLKAPGEHVNRGWLLSTIAALQAAQPGVPWVFADNRSLAEDYAFRWLAAAAKWTGAATSTGALPAPAAVQRPLAVRDRDGRYREASSLLAAGRADGGRSWTVRGYAAHFGISTATAAADLKALAAAGAVRGEGAGRGRRYVGGRGDGLCGMDDVPG